ncbi:Xaa-Pro peptidase family protein [Actinoplanes sp. NPDC024001]|uniref:M24 family metallopeptidase n=1 Tax=Actinoplanes sp. NPDC024001 TaxID=3154598 RepID=UPI0033FD6556
MSDDDLFTSERLSAAQSAMADAGLDALLVVPGPDLRYLTGYHALPLERLTCLVLPVSGPGTLIVPRLERPAAEASPAVNLGLQFVDYPDGVDPFPLVTDALKDFAAPSLGLSNQMWAEKVLGLQAVLPKATFGLANQVLTQLRIRKTPAEIAALRRAGQAIDEVHKRMGEWLRPGRTEDEVAADIAQAIREVGHATVEFTIVGSGPNGASPHHESSSRVINDGDIVVVDIGGAMPDGYGSDCTRMYVLGPTVPDEFRAGYEVLRKAHMAAIEAVRPGISAQDLDAVARDVLTEAGYGELFLHRTGHGIGLQGHEDPYIVAGNELILEAGMTFSIEPGVYWKDRFGARIEDIVVCTENGAERFNTLPTELVHL